MISTTGSNKIIPGIHYIYDTWREGFDKLMKISFFSYLNIFAAPILPILQSNIYLKH